MNAETRKYAKMVATYKLFASGFPRLSAHLPRPPFSTSFPSFLAASATSPCAGVWVPTIEVTISVIPLLPRLRTPLVGTPCFVPFPIAASGSKTGSRSSDSWLPTRRIQRYGFRSFSESHAPNSNSFCRRWRSRYVMDNRLP